MFVVLLTQPGSKWLETVTFAEVYQDVTIKGIH